MEMVELWWARVAAAAISARSDDMRPLSGQLRSHGTPHCRFLLAISLCTNALTVFNNSIFFSSPAVTSSFTMALPALLESWRHEIQHNPLRFGAVILAAITFFILFYKVRRYWLRKSITDRTSSQPAPTFPTLKISPRSPVLFP